MESQESVAVVGMGTMGRGIVEALLVSGFRVSCVDIDQAVVNSSVHKLKENLRKAFEKKRISENTEAMLERLKTGTSYDVVGSSSFVIEAVFENHRVKENVLKSVEPLLDRHAIMASNTSSLSVTALSSALGDPSRFVGLHFFNPAQKMPLVEIVRGARTSEDTLKRSIGLATALGKTPIIVKDSPGFVVNRLLIPYLLSAGKLLDEGVATAKDIDTCMKLGAGHPMGPFELSDLIGIDVIVDIAEELESSLPLPTRQALPISFRDLMEKKRFGRKTKGGFFDY